MHIFTTIKDIRAHLNSMRIEHKKIGFVPTMGALHAGHISLIQEANKSCDLVVSSIFVNPTQFNDPKDLQRYPRTEENDIEKLTKAGCDILFLPTVEEIYPNPNQLSISFGELENILEGEFRANHFSGVGIVVSKLFNIIQPDTAFFGQKDLQQCMIIKKLVESLCFDVDIQICPTKRADNGLALSSRNMLLSESDRENATLLYKSLKLAKDTYLKTQDIQLAKKEAIKQIEESGHFKIEYFSFVDLSNFKIVDSPKKPHNFAICVAAYLGKIRLIDNIIDHSLHTEKAVVV